MKSAWRKHVIICLFLGLLAMPIYFLDLASTEESGGSNWITLDFRGLIFWTYITLVAIEVALSSIAVLSFPKSGALRIHVGSNGTVRDPARRRGCRLRKSATGHCLESTANFDGESKTSHQRH
jgi:hypothetical protein